MAARRGRVAVSITADNTGLHHGLRSAETDVSRFGKTTEKSMHGLHKATELALGVTGLGGLAFGIKDLASEAVNAQAEQAKLAVAVKNSGKSWKAHREEIEKNLDAMSRTSGFAKSDLSAALANMIRTTGGLKDSWKDLSIAMDIARTRHIDLAGAQSLVARAALGNTRALKSLGIEVKPVTTAADQLKAAQQRLSDEMRNSSGATKEQIRLAKEHLSALSKQATEQDKNATRTRSLTILQQRFGGQSAAYARTSAGSFERARASLQLAEERIGNALLPALTSASNEVANLASGFAKDWPKIEKAVKPVAHDIGIFARGVGSMVAHNKPLAEAAAAFAGIALSVKGIEKVGSATGVTRLLGLGKTAATSVAARNGSGVTRALTGRGSPENPMYVVVVGGGGGPGVPVGPSVPGRGPSTVPGKVTVGQRALGTARTIGESLRPVIVVAGATKAITDAIRGGTGSDVAVLERYRKELDGIARTGAKRDMHKLAGDLRDQAVNVQSLSRGKDLKGLANALDDMAKTGNRRGLADIANSLRDVKVTGDGGALAGIIRDLDVLSKGSKKAGVDVGSVVRDTQAHFKELAQDGHVHMSEVKQAVVDNMGIIKLRLGADSKAGKEALSANFVQAADAVRGAMKAGDISTQTGLRLIKQYMAQAFKDLGINSRSAQTLADSGVTRKDLATGTSGPTVKVNGKHLPGAATGYIGRPGEHGHDAVPIVVGRGEAVLNRHQQAPVDTALRATFGIGLRDLFGRVRRPHYMAGGGFVEAPGTNYSVGDEPELARRLSRLANALGLHLTGISGYRSPQHSVEVGGFSNDPHTRGLASDTPGIEGVPERVLERFGLTRPFGGAREADHIQLLHGGKGGTAGLGVSIPEISITGGGAVGAVANAVVHKVRDAALASISSRMPFGGGTFSGGGVGKPGRGGAFSFGQLEKLWVKAGGPPRYAAIMAHVAEAESSGNPSARNPSGATGLWQILGNPFPGDPRDPLTNARMAVAKFRGGGLHPWDASRPAWGRYAPAGMAMGGFAGGDGGSIDDYAMAASNGGGGGVGGQIHHIVGSAPAPNGPKGKAPAKPTKGINPITHRIETHTRDQWLQIRLRYQRMHHHAPAQADATTVAVAKARADYTAAVASGNPARIRSAAARFKSAIGTRLHRIARLLSGADRNTSLALQRERATLAGYQKSIASELKRLNKKPKRGSRHTTKGTLIHPLAPAAGTGAAGGTYTQDIFDADYQNVEDALSDVDLHVQAGDITDAQGAAQKQTIVQGALAGGYGALGAHEVLSLRAQAGGFASSSSGTGGDSSAGDVLAAITALKDAIVALTGEEKRHNDIVAGVQGVDVRQATRFAADVLSGEIAGRVAGKALTAGAGTVFRA